MPTEATFQWLFLILHQKNPLWKMGQRLVHGGKWLWGSFELHGNKESNHGWVHFVVQWIFDCIFESACSNNYDMVENVGKATTPTYWWLLLAAKHVQELALSWIVKSVMITHQLEGTSIDVIAVTKCWLTPTNNIEFLPLWEVIHSNSRELFPWK